MLPKEITEISDEYQKVREDLDKIVTISHNKSQQLFGIIIFYMLPHSSGVWPPVFPDPFSDFFEGFNILRMDGPIGEGTGI